VKMIITDWYNILDEHVVFPIEYNLLYTLYNRVCKTDN